MKIFDYLEIENLGVNTKDKSTLKYKLENQSVIFLEKAKIDERWALISISRFIDYLKTRQQNGEITAGTIKNYYRAIKLF